MAKREDRSKGKQERGGAGKPAPRPKASAHPAPRAAANQLPSAKPLRTSVARAPAPVLAPTAQAPHSFTDKPAIPYELERGAPLPGPYGIDRLVLIARDPWTLFCYWELAGERLPSLKILRGEHFLQACAWALRLHRIDENVAHDIEIDAAAGCWYIHLDRQGKYQIELALLSPDGEWVPLLASHVVEMPVQTPSEARDTKFAGEIDADELRKLDALLYPNTPTGASFPGASRMPTSLSSWNMASSSMGSMSSMSSMSSMGSMSSLSSMGSMGSMAIGASRMSSPGGSSAGSGGSFFPGAQAAAQQEPQSNIETPAPGTPSTGTGGGDVRPTVFDGGPNWNKQPALPDSGPGKSKLPHFRIKLPRVVIGAERPEPSWKPQKAQ